MPKASFKPFLSESDCIQLGDLTIENRVDRVSIFGSIDITLDKPGLEIARQIKAVLDATIKEMEDTELPEQIEIEKAETVANPFA